MNSFHSLRLSQACFDCKRCMPKNPIVCWKLAELDCTSHEKYETIGGIRADFSSSSRNIFEMSWLCSNAMASTECLKCTIHSYIMSESCVSQRKIKFSKKSKINYSSKIESIFDFLRNILLGSISFFEGSSDAFFGPSPGKSSFIGNSKILGWVLQKIVYF